MGAGSFVIREGAGPVIATAIHAGHGLRDECAQLMALDDAGRLREEDPFTQLIAAVAPTQIVATQSRFQVDLNRKREAAVYLQPADAWGLDVWHTPPPAPVIAASLAEYDAFYAALERVARAKVAEFGAVVVLDVHSYNHRRGETRAAADVAGNPEINVGTKSANRARWGNLIERFLRELSETGTFDVRENVKFTGGAMAQWINATFPQTGIALALEYKKTFMDEWTGVADVPHLERLARALAATLPGLVEELGR